MNCARNEREVSQREGRVNVSNWVLRRILALGRRVAHTRGKRRRTRRRDSDDGIALLMALLVTMLLAAVSGGLLLLATTESRIAGAEEFRSEAHGVAEVMLERALQELLQTPDWSAVLAGAAVATFRDTASAPPWVAAGWGALDLSALTRQVQRDADVANRWGRDGPGWQLYAYGRADGLFGAAGVGASGGAAGGGGPAGGGAAGGDPGRERAARFYAIAWVADDPGEGDGDPAADRNETVQVRADAFGPMRTRHTVLATVRRNSGMLQVTSWREPEPP